MLIDLKTASMCWKDESHVAKVERRIAPMNRSVMVGTYQDHVIQAVRAAPT
jgi:hypothetical protein